VDPFVVITGGSVLGMVIVVLVAARSYPGSGADLINWRPTRSPEVEAQNEVDDLEQLLEVANRRRRRRGEAEVTVEGMHAKVAAEQREAAQRLAEYRASRAAGADTGESHMAHPESAAAIDAEIDELLAMSNARRRKKGLPEVTVEEYKRQIEQGPEGSGT
jgi:hypothetical protein